MTQSIRNRQQGFGIIELFVIIIVISAIGFIVWWVFIREATPASNTASTSDAQLEWSFDGETWSADSPPPDCPTLTLTAPADLDKATAALYPGQYRGGDYKPHGGLRFDNQTTTAVTVRAPFDGVAVHGSRYIERGETQYLLFFVHPCGIAYRFDHLLTLSPALQQLVDTLPEPKVDDSRTTKFANSVSVKAGQEIATAVGFTKGPNVSFDLGVYDLRSQNKASENPAYAQQHGQAKELTFYAVCWFDWLGASDLAKINALPAADSVAGKMSDYCK